MEPSHKIELALLQQISQNHRLAYEQGKVPELFSRAKLYGRVAEALALRGCLLVEGQIGKCNKIGS